MVAHAVFDTRAGTIYDDEIARRYHFPNRYLPEAKRVVGQWVVYREPRREGGREGYVAVAHVVRIEGDPADAGKSYAIMADYLPFDRVVPLKSEAGFYEATRLADLDPRRIGAAIQGRSIRDISPIEFGLIVVDGLADTLDPFNARRLGLRDADPETRALLEAEPFDKARQIQTLLVNRRIRDAAFRRAVVDAYDGTCAVTGLRMVNGGESAEAQAAHIVPVAEDGPDVVQNGLALSATVHWLFDRHLISLTDDYRLLVAHNRVPAELRALFAKQLDGIHLPRNPAFRPNLDYVRRHRQAFAGH